MKRLLTAIFAVAALVVAANVPDAASAAGGPPSDWEIVSVPSYVEAGTGYRSYREAEDKENSWLETQPLGEFERNGYTSGSTLFASFVLDADPSASYRISVKFSSPDFHNGELSLWGRTPTGQRHIATAWEGWDEGRWHTLLPGGRGISTQNPGYLEFQLQLENFRYGTMVYYTILVEEFDASGRMIGQYKGQYGTALGEEKWLRI